MLLPYPVKYRINIWMTPRKRVGIGALSYYLHWFAIASAPECFITHVKLSGVTPVKNPASDFHVASKPQKSWGATCESNHRYSIETL